LDTTEIEIDAFPDTIFYGLVSEIAHTAQNLNMGSQQQVTNFKVKIKVLNPPHKIRPGMSSTVNIISKTIKNAISIPIQSLASRPKNYEELSENDDFENDDVYSNLKEGIDVVFTLVDNFNGEKTAKDEKYAVVKPVDVGLSSENYYAVNDGVIEGDIIVTGRYRVLSKELQHGMKVSYKIESSSY